MARFEDNTVLALLLRAHRIALRTATAMLMESGVSPMEAWLLELIPDDGRACATELAERLSVPTSTVTRTLRRLESHGYLTLTKGHFLDVRVLRAKLTPLGVDIRNAAAGFERDVDAVLLEGIKQNAFAGLLAGLSHMERAGRRYGSPDEAESGSANDREHT